MVQISLIRSVVIPIALFCGSLSVFWNVAITTRLSSTLPDPEAWIPPLSNLARQYQFDDQRESNQTELVALQSNAYEHVETNATLPTREYGKVYNSTAPHVSGSNSKYFPRIVNIDGSAASTITTKKRRSIDIERTVLREWSHIEDDNNYPIVDSTSQEEECVQMSSWQSDSYPNCNFIHEVDLPAKSRIDEFYYVASGGSNDVFRTASRNSSGHGQNPDIALKMLSPKKKHLPGIPPKQAYSHENFDIVRRDALVMERLTRSRLILDLYGYCGFSVTVPFANSGTLGSALAYEWSRSDKIWKNITSATRLRHAADAAKGLADIHELGVVHADLTVKQYLNRNGVLQLHDFNQGIFLQKNSTANDTACTFDIPTHYGTTRAPEEYKKEPQTSAVDVWSLGSIIYYLLTGRKVWYHHKKHEAKELVVNGSLPAIDQQILDSPDPVDQVLKKALDKCFAYEPSQRGTAKEVALFLRKELEKIG